MVKIKYHYTDLQNQALKENKNFDIWLQENDEYKTNDNIFYYLEFNKKD